MEHPLAYDVLPYQPEPHEESKPDRLAAVAKLFGLAVPERPPRVLELGCATGGNLVPMASLWSDWSFVGCDLFLNQVVEARQAAEELGLKNVRFEALDMRAIGPDLGQFDFIIANGVWSWVEADVRDAMFRICRQCLSPNGIAYITYNVYPGWGMRGTIRDILRNHALRFDGARQQVEQARALSMLLRSAIPQHHVYRTALVKEIDLLHELGDEYVFHEHLTPINHPVWFSDFVEQARTHHLRYLGDADVELMLTGDLAPDHDAAIRGLSEDQEQLEQYLDLVRVRHYRRSLLIHGERTIDRTMQSAPIRDLYLATRLAANPVGNGSFKDADGREMVTADPRVIAAMEELSGARPGALSFDEMCAGAGRRLGKELDADEVRLMATNFLHAVGNGVVQVQAWPDPFRTGVSERPVGFGPARRLAAKRFTRIPSARLRLVGADALDGAILPLADGTRTVEDLAKAAILALQQGAFSLPEDWKTPEGTLESVAPRMLAEARRRVENWAQVALLVA